MPARESLTLDLFEPRCKFFRTRSAKSPIQLRWSGGPGFYPVRLCLGGFEVALVGSWLDDVKLSFISTIVAPNAAAFAKFSLKWFKLAGSWDANKTNHLRGSASCRIFSGDSVVTSRS
jgi:hypothetical protein